MFGFVCFIDFSASPQNKDGNYHKTRKQRLWGKIEEAGVTQLEERWDTAIISKYREGLWKEEGIAFLPGR